MLTHKTNRSVHPSIDFGLRPPEEKENNKATKKVKEKTGAAS